MLFTLLGCVRMWFCGLIVVFSLLHLFYCQTYEDLENDVCFKKIYVCGDLRSRISGENGELITNARRFVGRCKANKEFMACVDEAEIFCKGKLNDFSEMVLKNRKGLKEICAEPLWGQRYINHAACINKNIKRISRECRDEVRNRADRPWWCLIPEPCDAIEKVFTCTIQGLEINCGRYSGEIYRKIQILKVDNQDVVCEFRRRNPMYCKYDREPTFNLPPRPRREAPEDEHSTPAVDISTTLDSIQSAVSEAVRNVAKAITIDVIESVVKTVESSAVKSKDEKFFNETLGKFFKEVNLLKANVIFDEEYQKLVNIDELNSKSAKFLKNSNNKLSEPNYSHVLLENVLNSVCPSQKITEECFQIAKNMWKIARVTEAPESTDISNIAEHLKAILTKVIKLLEKRSIVMDHTEKQITIYLDGLGSLALEELQCSLVSHGILKCILDMESGCSNVNEAKSSQTEGSSEEVGSNAHSKVLLVDSTEPESEYLADLVTEASWQDATKASTLDASELGDSSEVEDRVGDLYTTEIFNAFESEESSSPLETLESNKKGGESVSLMDTTTEFSILNTDKSYILLGTPYLPTESSTMYLTTENEDHTSNVYIVSPDSISNAELDSSTVASLDAENISLGSSVEPSTDIEEESKLDTAEDGKHRILQDAQQQKLEEVLSEIFEVSTAGMEAPKLNENVSDPKLNPEDQMHYKLPDPFAVKTQMGSMPSYKTMNLNGLADVYPDDSANLNELLRKIEFEVAAESSKTVDGSLEEQVSDTDKNEKEPSIVSCNTDPTFVNSRSEL